MQYTKTHDATHEAHLLSGIEPSLETASTGKRFLHFLIDTIAYYAFIYVLVLLLSIFVGEPFQLFILESGENVLGLYSIGIYFLYLSLQEGLCNGRTLGKLCTGCRVVNEEGNRIGLGTAMLRTLVRFVPFEVFSAFGYRAWHDSWTKTYVIDIKKSTFPDEIAAY